MCIRDRFLILQQIEGNFIYPKVVGTSVGLPSIWVLAAVTVGGGVMGIFGMLVAVPLSSVLYSLLRDSTNRRLARRGIPCLLYTSRASTGYPWRCWCSG